MFYTFISYFLIEINEYKFNLHGNCILEVEKLVLNILKIGTKRFGNSSLNSVIFFGETFVLN